MNFSKVGHAYEQVAVHAVFWIVCVIVSTLIYAVGMPNYGVTLAAVLMLLPVHMLYYYTLSSIVIPKYLYTRKFFAFGLSLLIVGVCCLFLYRTVEILCSDPFLFKSIRKIRPDFKWSKIEGSFAQQFLDVRYMIHALEQSNTIVWICLVIKFFKMWYERKQVALHSELSFLKAQIHPHFLFNTLNNLYALTLNQSPSSPIVVLGLSEILRYMLYECNSDYVPLQRDVEILQNYITLEKLRYEDRLDLNFNIKGTITNQQIAPLLMMPLLENAFKHGVSEMTDDAWINVDLEINENRLKFKVSNSRPLEKGENTRIHFGKIGISNVRKRLELIYPEAFTFTIYDEEEMYVAIMEIKLTAIKQPKIISKPAFQAVGLQKAGIFNL